MTDNTGLIIMACVALYFLPLVIMYFIFTPLGWLAFNVLTVAFWGFLIGGALSAMHRLIVG